MALDPQIQAKASSMRALMSSPDMANSLFSALQAPVGSTQTQRGSAILDSVFKNANNQFGGPSGTLNSPTGSPTSTNISQGGLIPSPFPSTPAPKATEGMLDLDPNAPVQNKTFFLKSVDDLMSSSSLGKALQQSPNSVFSPTTLGSTASGLNTGSFDPTSPTSGVSIGGALQTGQWFRPIGDKSTPATSPQQFQFQGSQGDQSSISALWAQVANQNKPKTSSAIQNPVVPGTPQPNASPQPLVSNQGEANILAKQMLDSGKPWSQVWKEINDKYGFTVAYPTGGLTPDQIKDLDAKDAAAQANGAIDPNTGVSTDSNLDSSSIIGMPDQMRKDWYNKLDPAAKEYYKPLYDALNTGIGADAWAIKMLGDKNALSKITGIPVAALKSLPDSGLLSQHLSDLMDAKKQEFHVNDLLTSLVQKQASGLTIKPDLEAYIRGKDEYLGTVDKMLDGAETKIANMDTSNPNINNRMQNWVNYLTVIKGRQNQRYTDYLNTSIQYHSDDLNRTNLQYQYATQQAKDAYDSQAPIDTEEYNNLKTTLSNIYTSVDNRTNGTSDLFKNQYDLMKTQQDIANGVLEGQIKKVGLASDTLEYNKKLLGEPEKVLPGKLDDFRATFFPKDKETKDQYGTSYTPFTYRDPIQVLQELQGTQQDVGGFFSAYTGYISDNLANKVRGGTFISDLNEYKKGAQDLADTRDALTQAGDPRADEINSYLQSFGSAVSQALSSGGAGTALSHVTELRTAIEKLGKEKYKSATDLSKSKEGQAMGPDLVSVLWNQYKKTTAPGSGTTPKQYAANRNNLSDTELANYLGGLLRDNYMTK